jgi:very-short-patch-repair endonuclease
MLKNKNTGIENIDYIKCPLCTSHVKQITQQHAKMHGFISSKDMKIKLQLPEITCDKIKKMNQGNNNPGYQHNGKFSKFSKKFIHGYNKEWNEQHVKNIRQSRKDHPEKYINTIEYWMLQTNGNIEEAKKLQSHSQTRDLKYFINKYGEEDGTRRHLAKTEKWIKSFKKQNFSKISQELFNSLIQKLNDKENIYFATYERENMKKYKNKEYRLKLEKSFILPDFIDVCLKKIIEFDGNYWHGSAKANPQREQARDIAIKHAGFQVLHIAEQEYKQNKQEVIDKCINFLIK